METKNIEQTKNIEILYVFASTIICVAPNLLAHL